MANYLIGRSLAGRILRRLGKDEGADRGTSSVRVNPPIPVGYKPRIYGKLDADLNCNNPSATATLSIWEWDSGEEEDVDTGRDVEVCVPFASKLGYILAGMMVEAEWSSGARSYMVVAGGKAKHIWIEADSDWYPRDAEVSGSVVHWSDGEDPDPEDAGIAVLNGRGNLKFRGLAGDSVPCRYLPEDNRYEAENAPCPPDET
jgi:hypothetical protein